MNARIGALRAQQTDEAALHAPSSAELAMHEKAVDQLRPLVDDLPQRFSQLVAEERRLRSLVEKLR